MSEDTLTCRIHKKHKWIKCTNPALSGDPDGLCILHSQDRAKDPEAFKEALRSRWQQEDAEFYDFRKVFFPGPFDPKEFFGSREFTKPVKFTKAIFTKMAYFSHIIFLREANFNGVTFLKEANFWKSTFKEDAYFSDASFTKGAHFLGATFTKGTYFSGATFEEQSYFSMARVEGLIVFSSINRLEEEGAGPHFQCDFRLLELGPWAILRFQDLSLAHVEFAGTDLRRVEFHHVQWHPYRGRQAVYDEVLLRQRELSPSNGLAFPTGIVTFALEIGPKINEFIAQALLPPDPPTGNEYGEVERLYRNLKLNYEEAGDFKNAGDFHYGEMEMHRRASKWRWFPFYWYNLWRSNGYGEYPLRALGWLSIFFMLISIWVWLLGLKIINSGQLADFSESIIYILQKVTLQRPTWAIPVGFWGNLVAGFSVLLIPGQAALFLLALRNRLGRRR